MSASIEIYFPENLPDWGFVRDEFPFPLAITCARLLAEMERQEPIAAAWALRDAFECLIKFSASLAVADFLHAQLDPKVAEKIAEVLLKPSGLSLGDWHTVLELALKPLAGNGELGASGRVLLSLVPVFFEKQVRPRPTELNRKIDGGADSFVAWRNRVFGHGVFSQDRRYYAQETLAWLPVLGNFYAALRPVLADRRLLSQTPGGDEVVWQGTGDLPLVPRHEHEPWGDPLPMFLAPVPGYELPLLPLTPLLSVQQCQSCGQPAAFFFDKNKYDRKQDRHSTAFLEYFNGHPGTQKDWSGTQRLAALLPPTFNWERTNYDGEEVDGGINIVFRDFDTEYLRPDYLLDAVWDITDTQAKGYIHLTGPGGGGKTYFVRGLAAEGQERGAAVLAYHILSGARTAYQTFVSELNDYARDTLRFRTQEPQMRADTPEGMQAEFVSYLAELMRANKIDLLVVAIDALDELADPADGTFGLTDFLPPTADLPEGCFLVLTSRDDLRPKVRVDVERLQRSAPGEFIQLSLETGNAGNQDLLRAYLMKRLPAALQTPDAVEAVLERSGGVFLYAFHLCRALEAGVFPDLAALPDGTQFYPAYLERLRARVGDHLYDTVYLPTLLLLCAAMQPVTLDQLARWGVPRDRLHFALLDLHDFLRVHRELPWQDRLGEPDGENRYEMAHEAFVRFVQENPSTTIRLHSAHATIAHIARNPDQWQQLDPTDSVQLYDIRWLPTHLGEADLHAEQTSLFLDKGFADVCWQTAVVAQEISRHHLSWLIVGAAVNTYDRLLEKEWSKEDALNLAQMWILRGQNAYSLRLFWAAEEVYRSAISVLYSIKSRLPEAVNVRFWGKLLAEAILGLAVAVAKQGGHEAALRHFDAALEIFRRLSSGIINEEVRRKHIQALALKSNSLLDLERPEEALILINEALEELEKWQDTNDFIAELHADLLRVKSGVLIEMGQDEEAAICDRRSLHYYDLTDTNTTREYISHESAFTSRRAKTLANRAYVLEGLESFDEAIECLEAAAEIFSDMVYGEFRWEVIEDLADALNRKGQLYSRQAVPTSAADTYNELAGLYQWLLDGGMMEFRKPLAEALLRFGLAWESAYVADASNRPENARDIISTALQDALNIFQQVTDEADQREVASATSLCAFAQNRLGQKAEAITACDATVTAYRRVLAQGWDEGIGVQLATMLTWGGQFHLECENYHSAAKTYSEAVDAWEQVRRNNITAPFISDLCRAAFAHVACLTLTYRLEEAWKSSHKAVAILSEARRSAGADHDQYVWLTSLLISVYERRGELQLRLEKPAGARASYRKGASLARAMVQSGYIPLVPEAMRMEAASFSVSAHLADWTSAAMSVLFIFDLLYFNVGILDEEECFSTFQEFLWIVRSRSENERTALYNISAEQVAERLKWPEQEVIQFCQRYKEWPSALETLLQKYSESLDDSNKTSG